MRLILGLILASAALAQTNPVTLGVNQQFNITSSSQYFDNRSSLRQCSTYTFAVTSGTGSWSAQLEYSTTSPGGPWTSFGGSSVVTSTSSSPVGWAYGYKPFVRINTTAGTTVSNFSCESDFYIPDPGIGSSALPATTNPFCGTGTAGQAKSCIPGIDYLVPSGDGSGLTNVHAAYLLSEPIGVTAPSSGQVLGFNGAQWVPVTGASGNATSIQGTPVSATAPTNGQSLVFNGTDWIPATESGASGPSILATDSSIGWVCDGSTVNSNTVIAATNSWFKANANGTMYFPKNSTCLHVSQTSTSSIVVDTMLLGVSSARLVGDNTAFISTTQAGGGNVINFQTGQSEFNCFSGSVTNPTVNYDYTATPILTVGAGSTTVTATGFTGTSGDRILVYGFDQLNAGFPPDYRYFERHVASGIAGATVTLDSPLSYGYNSTWPYNNAVNTTPPSIRDLTQTCTGGGTVQQPHYIYVQGFDFSQVTSANSGSIPIVYAGGADYVEFANDNFGYISPEGGSTMYVHDSTVQWMEVDKLQSKIFFKNVTFTGNQQFPSDSCIVSGSGNLYAEFDSVTFKCQPGFASRDTVYNSPVFYSQSSQPYGFVSNGSFGYQSSIKINNPVFYKNGVSQSGIFGANNGYQIAVAAVPTSSTFTVTATASANAVQQYVGPNTIFYDHVSGVYIGQSNADPYLNGGVLTVSGSFVGGACNAAAPNLGGSGYVTGDIIQVIQGSASGCRFSVTASGGVVTGLTRLSAGAGYTTGTSLSTSRLSGSGSGATVDISSIMANPYATQSVDVNTNAETVNVYNPVAADFDINTIPPVFDAGATAHINSFSMQFPPSTTIADLGPCNSASTFASKWVTNAANQSSIATTGSTPTQVYCIGVDQFSGSWVTVSAISTPYLNGISTATNNTVLNAGVYSFLLTGTQQSPTSGNGVFPQPIQIIGAKGQNTTGTTGQQAGTGQSLSFQPGPGGNAAAGSLNGYSGNIEFDSNVGGTGGSSGGVGYVGMGNNVAAPTKIGGAGGANCFGVIALTGTCGNGLYGQYFSGSELHTGTITINGGILNTSNLDSGFYTTVASASTITPTGLVNKITGNNTISQINAVPGAGGSTQISSISLLADPAGTGFTLNAGTNIYLPGGASSYTLSKGQIVELKYDSTALSWYCLGCSNVSVNGSVTSGHFPTYFGTSGLIQDQGFAPQGTDLNLLTSGTISGTAGTQLCLDANGGATTTTCSVSLGLYNASTNPLPTCNSGFQGQFKAVTDATSPTYNGTYTGGGTAHVPVYCNGTSWITP